MPYVSPNPELSETDDIIAEEEQRECTCLKLQLFVILIYAIFVHTQMLTSVFVFECE